MLILYRDAVELPPIDGHDRWKPKEPMKAKVLGIRVPLWFGKWLWRKVTVV